MNNMIVKDLYRAALLCGISYKVPSEIDTIVETDDRYNSIKKIITDNNMLYIENSSFKCYMFKYRNTIYISVHSFLPFNYNSKMKRYNGRIYIHEGILHQFNVMEPELIKNIKELDCAQNVKKIHVCGYNIGGALSSVISSFLANKYKNIYLVSCFTFGSPKVGNKSFKKVFNENVTSNYRITTNKLSTDEETSLLSSSRYSYCHVCNPLYLENNNIAELKSIHRTHFPICNNKPTRDIDPLETYIQCLHNIIVSYKHNSSKSNSSQNSNTSSITITIPYAGNVGKQIEPIIGTNYSPTVSYSTFELEEKILKIIENSNSMITAYLNQKSGDRTQSLSGSTSSHSE
jgi:hypothetical protein